MIMVLPDQVRSTPRDISGQHLLDHRIRNRKCTVDTQSTLHLLLHCCFSVAILLLHCCFTVVLLHYCYTVATLCAVDTQSTLHLRVYESKIYYLFNFFQIVSFYA
jgi:hypothetical protein